MKKIVFSDLDGKVCPPPPPPSKLHEIRISVCVPDNNPPLVAEKLCLCGDI